MPAHIAIIDASGRIVFVNRAWRDYAQKFGKNGDEGLCVGANYLTACRNVEEKKSDATTALRGISELLEGRRHSYTMEYLCPTPLGDTWYRLDAGPIRLSSGNGALLSHIDITPQKKAEIAVRASERNLRAMFQNAGVGIAEIDADGGWLRANARLRQLLRLSPAELRAVTFFSLVHPDERDAQQALIETMRQGEIDAIRVEARLRRLDRVYVWVHLTVSSVRAPDGRLEHFIAVIVDISERKQAEERQYNLMRELAHRGKNLLAVIDAIANRTLRGDGPLQMAREALSGRLHALASTYDSLIQESFEGAQLNVLLENELAAFGARAHFQGPRVVLTVKAAQTFGLLAHELATNAVKYGALSVPGGEIAIRWRESVIADTQRLAFDWRETGGPPAAAPLRRGFGSEILEQVVRSEFDCQPTLDFDPLGFRYSFEAPLDRIGAIAPETPLRAKLRQPRVLAVYDEWVSIVHRGAQLPRLMDFDWPRLAVDGSVTIARVSSNGEITFGECDPELRGRRGEAIRLAAATSNALQYDAESCLRCARDLTPKHDLLRLDFEQGPPAVYERLMLPFQAANDPGSIFVVGFAVFDESRAKAP